MTDISHPGNPNACEEHCRPDVRQTLLDRRDFLLGTGAVVTAMSLPVFGPETVQVRKAEYPKKKIGKLSRLTVETAVEFQYPGDGAGSIGFLVKLTQRAGGGVGPEKNVVAFNALCTHQGASMAGTFDGKAGIAGPCPLHWTTFDLTRHGMVVSGHATSGLPQILLETEGDDIIAVGVMGLIFGRLDNFTEAEAPKQK